MGRTRCRMYATKVAITSRTVADTITIMMPRGRKKEPAVSEEREREQHLQDPEHDVHDASSGYVSARFFMYSI